MTEGGGQGPKANAPLWLKELVDSVAGHMSADSPMGPLIYRYGEEEGFWLINLYPSPVELMGGAVDGEVVDPGFSLDLEGLRGAFDVVTDIGWQSLGFPHGVGPHVWIEGRFQNHEVLLSVLASAPEDEEPGMQLDMTGDH